MILLISFDFVLWFLGIYIACNTLTLTEAPDMGCLDKLGGASEKLI